MTATARLDLPFLQAGQALKNITHNEALQRLDSGLYLSCSNMDANSLPGNPAEDLVVLISQSPDITLLDRVGQIAVFTTSGWVWFTPKPGWSLWDETEQTLRIFNGKSWVPPMKETFQDSLPKLGLNATATTEQRLSISSENSLFNHDGNSHRLTLNRAAQDDTASLIFQTGFTGGAELGLTGAGGFSLKTSSDGTHFTEKLSTPATYNGIQSPAFGSNVISVEHNTATLIPTPATGGIVALTITSKNGFPQVGHSGIFAYDTGGTPLLRTLSKTTRVDNHASLILDGTISTEGNIGVSAVEGGLYLENRIVNTRDFSLTFIC